MWHKEIKTTPSTVYLLQLQFLPHKNTDISFIVSKLLSCWLTQTTSEGPDDTGCVSNFVIVIGCDVISHFTVSSSVRTDAFLSWNGAGLWRFIVIYTGWSKSLCARHMYCNHRVHRDLLITLYICQWFAAFASLFCWLPIIIFNWYGIFLDIRHILARVCDRITFYFNGTVCFVWCCWCIFELWADFAVLSTRITE